MSEAKTWLENAVDLFDETGFNDGDLISWDWLAYAMWFRTPKDVDQCKEIQLENFSKMDEFRNHLLSERKVALENVRGEGYRIVPPRQQSEYAARTMMKHIQKGIKSGSAIIENTRISKLTIEEKRRHTDVHIRLCGLSQMADRHREDIFSLFNPKKTG